MTEPDTAALDALPIRETRGMYVDPEQTPTTLAEPSMQPGQPTASAATVRCIRPEPHDPHEWWAGHETKPWRCPGVILGPIPHDDENMA